MLYQTVHKKWSFPLRISGVNVTKPDLVTFTEEILDRKLHFFVQWKEVKNRIFRSSHRRCFVRKGVLRNFSKFTGKQLCQVLFLLKVQASACNFIKKDALVQVFSCELCEISLHYVKASKVVFVFYITKFEGHWR